jgi:CRP-like cAMP-binding protein
VTAKPAAPVDDLAKSTRFFADLPPHLANELVQHGRRFSIEKGALVHHKGDPPDGLYQLISGRIRISTVSDDGRELVLADLTPGSFFGEISLFDGLPRTHDALALEKSELLIVPTQKFHALLAEKPALAKHFLHVLSAKLRLCFAALDALSLQGVPERLAQRLLWLAERGGKRAVTVSQTDLALMVGATRQSINKQLKAWERAGLVALRGRRIVLEDAAALRRLAGL